jgi:hypothetical protein
VAAVLLLLAMLKRREGRVILTGDGRLTAWLITFSVTVIG